MTTTHEPRPRPTDYTVKTYEGRSGRWAFTILYPAPFGGSYTLGGFEDEGAALDAGVAEARRQGGDDVTVRHVPAFRSTA